MGPGEFLKNVAFAGIVFYVVVVAVVIVMFG